MLRRSTPTIAALTATLILAATTTATARRIQISEQRFHQAWTGLHLSFGMVTITCPLTLEGSFHSKTTSKVTEQLIGYITRPIVGNSSCSGGHLTPLTETLPWHITYESFSGVLPRIWEMHLLLIGAAFRMESAGATCTWRTTATEPAEGWIFIEPTTGQVRELELNPNKMIRTNVGCLLSTTVRPEGISEVFAGGIETGNTTRITVKLVQ